jgi:hypothetical protein
MSARKLRSFLDSSATLVALSAQVERLLELQRLWEQIAPPPLAHACNVASLRDQVLALYANNGAIAAKVRQLAPTLLEKAQKSGLEVTAISVRVQARPAIPENKPIKNLHFGPSATSSLRRLVASLDESPLRQALKRMLERHSSKDDTPHDDQGTEHK